jgi:hypothetical protein
MKTFTQFLEQRDPELYEQMLNEGFVGDMYKKLKNSALKAGAIGAMGIGSLFGGGDYANAQAPTTKQISPLSGGYTPGLGFDNTDLGKFKGPNENIKYAKTAENILYALDPSEEHVSKVIVKNLANKLNEIKPTNEDTLKILKILGEKHKVMTQDDIAAIVAVVPEEIKGKAHGILEKARQRHQNQRDDFFKRNDPERIKGLDGDKGYFDSSGKGSGFNPYAGKQILEIYDTRQESVGARIANIGVQIEFASKDTIEKKRKVLENYKQLLKELADEYKRKYRTQLVSYARAIEDMLKSDSQIAYDPRINKETIQNRGDRLKSRHFVAPPETINRLPTKKILPTNTNLQRTV